MNLANWKEVDGFEVHEPVRLGSPASQAPQPDADGWINCHEGMPDLAPGEYAYRYRGDTAEYTSDEFSLLQNLGKPEQMRGHQYRHIKRKAR